MELADVRHDVVYNDSTDSVSHRDGTYTSVATTTTTASKLQSHSAPPTSSWSGDAASSWTEQGTISGHDTSRERHTFKLTGAKVGRQSTNGGSRYSGTYSNEEESWRDLGGGMPVFTGSSTNHEERRTISAESSTTRLNSLVTKHQCRCRAHISSEVGQNIEAVLPTPSASSWSTGLAGLVLILRWIPRDTWPLTATEPAERSKIRQSPRCRAAPRASHDPQLRTRADPSRFGRGPGPV